jgi:hypothetical protein
MDNDSLSLRCIEIIAKNFNLLSLEILESLPAEVIQRLLNHFLELRKMGFRTLCDQNIWMFFIPAIKELNLESFWISDKPFLKHFDCPYLEFVNFNKCLQVLIFILVVTNFSDRKCNSSKTGCM